LKKFLLILFGWFTLINVFATQAPEELDSLLRKLKSVPEADRCMLMNEISRSYISTDPQAAFEYANQAYEIALKTSDSKGEGYSQLNIAKSLFMRGEVEASLPFIQNTLSISRKIEDKSLLGEGYNLLGNYYMTVGNLSKSLEVFQEGLSNLRLPEDERGIAMIKSNLANLYNVTGEYRKAMDLFFDVLNVYEKKNDKENIAIVKNNIALSYHELLNFDKAMEYYQQALDIHRELGQVSSQVIPLNNIAEIHKDRKEYDKALETFRQCYGLGIYLNNESYKGMGLLGMGETYLLMEKFDDAAKNLNEAKTIFETLNYAENLSQVYFNLGELFFRKGDISNAKISFDKSLKLAQDLRQVELLGKNYEALSNLAVLSGNYKAAYEYYRNFSTISDSVYKESRENILSEMIAKYDLTKKEGEVVFLQQENASKELELEKKKIRNQLMWGLIFGLVITLGLLYRLYSIKRNSNRKLKSSYEQIAEQKEELEQLNGTKDKLLSIIAHDLRGPVGVTKNMLYQLIKDPDVFTPEEQSQIMEELFLVSEKTHDLLENLLSWANNQRGLKISKDSISVRKLIETNVEQQEIFARKKGVKLYSQVSADYNVFCDINMINLVIRNLISNAIKFTPAKGTITITGYKTDNFYKVVIQDNGVGMPPEVMNRIFDSKDFYTSYGTNREKGSGLGLKLCKEFVEKNGGQITVDSDQGRGTTFAFTLEITSSSGISPKSEREAVPEPLEKTAVYQPNLVGKG
jgi:signal transduction histidine kinase